MTQEKVRPERGKEARKTEKQWVNETPIADFGDGFALYELTAQEDLDTEGKLMHHCSYRHTKWIETGAHKLYSLRDLETQTPHCTLLLVKVGAVSPYNYNSTFRAGEAPCQVTIDGVSYIVSEAAVRGCYYYRDATEGSKHRMYYDLIIGWLRSHPHE